MKDEPLDARFIEHLDPHIVIYFCKYCRFSTKDFSKVFHNELCELAGLGTIHIPIQESKG